MGKHIKCRKAKFWLEEGILFCEFIPKECKKEFSEDFIEDYLEAIATLSNGRYFPMLIDVRQLSNAYALSVVKLLSKNSELKLAILSKSFVVNSFFLQFVLIVIKGFQDPVIPNKIFTRYENAINYSLKTNYIFNSQ
ncbi:hypothetical protein VP395_06055 [Mariniflexile soesokkakense]|uniref:DUF7793 domain-containing protein n=1 Tax=Mariniflexile soesokkakense TaxID=1343160 RepID=A0ABV0AAR4_9FLAO